MRTIASSACCHGLAITTDCTRQLRVKTNPSYYWRRGQKDCKNQRSGSIRSNSVFRIPWDCSPHHRSCGGSHRIMAVNLPVRKAKAQAPPPPIECTPSRMGMGKVRRKNSEWKMTEMYCMWGRCGCAHLLTPACRKQQQADLCEVQVSLVYLVSSTPDKAT